MKLIFVSFTRRDRLHDGKGIDEADAKALFELGVHVITPGNHLWDRWQVKITSFQKKRNILRTRLKFIQIEKILATVLVSLMIWKRKGRVGSVSMCMGRDVYANNRRSHSKRRIGHWANGEGKVKGYSCWLLYADKNERQKKWHSPWLFDHAWAPLFGQTIRTSQYMHDAAGFLPKGSAYITDVWNDRPVRFCDMGYEKRIIAMPPLPVSNPI